MASSIQSLEAAEAVVQTLSSLTASNSFACLRGVVANNTELRDEVRELKTANKSNIKIAADAESRFSHQVTLTKAVTARLEESENKAKLCKSEIEKLTGKLAERQKELISTAEHVTKLQNELKRREVEVANAEKRARAETDRADSATKVKALAVSELSEKQEVLNDYLAKLDQVESYSIKQLDAPLQSIPKVLKGIWRKAYSLVSNFCSDDLDDNNFSKTEQWKTLHSRVANERIPIINGSNSSIAKHMRVAAALSIISGVLCERILQPNYVLKHSNELTDVLDELLDDDFSREQHLRAELLALNVERQKENGAVRFEDAVVEIFSCCEIMVLQERHQDFRAALERFCKQVLSKWTEFQSLKERVEPSFNQNCHENWFLLPSPVIQLRNGHTSTKQSNIAPSPGTASGTRGTGHDDVEEAVLSEIKVIVWPCFLLTNIKGYQTISEGFVLSNAQIQEAEDEERTSVTRGPYQFFRRSSKRTRSDFIAVNANGNQAQDDKSFLSGKPSANSNDG